MYQSICMVGRRLTSAKSASARALSSFQSSPGVVDGRAVASALKADLREQIAELKLKSVVPGLAVILVGDRTDSATYVNMKQKACKDTGINSHLYKYPASESEAEILNRGKTLHCATILHLCLQLLLQ